MKVKKRKKIFIITLFVLVSILLTGCMVSKGSVERKAKKYLQKKYDEKFVFDSWGSTSSAVGGSTYTLYFYPQEHEDWKITVAWDDSWGKPSYEFRDNYLLYVYQEDAEKILRQLIEPIYGDCIVFLGIDDFSLSKEYEAQITPQFMLRNGSNPLTIYTSNEKRNREQDFVLFKEAIIGEKYRIDAWIVYISEDEMNLVLRGNMKEIFTELNVAYGYAIISTKHEYIRWGGEWE